jgi:hypothetical protein
MYFVIRIRIISCHKENLGSASEASKKKKNLISETPSTLRTPCITAKFGIEHMHVN